MASVCLLSVEEFLMILKTMNDNQTKMFVNGVFNFFVDHLQGWDVSGGRFGLNSLQILNSTLVQYI